MPWCPNCRTEYRDGFQVCSDCGETLVDRLEEENDSGTEPAMPLYREDRGLVLVSACPDNHQAAQVEALLLSADIPVIRKLPGAGSYLTHYMGVTRYGADLYVPPEYQAQAQELLESVQGGQGQGLPLLEPGDELPQPNKWGKRVGFLLLVFVLPVVLALTAVVMMIYDILF